MPVLVTGAEDALGAAVIARLRTAGGEVRAYLDATAVGDVEARALRAGGCKVAVGELDDEGHLEAALTQVHTVAHCWGGPLHDPDSQVEHAATLASALLGAGVRRLVWVRELATAADSDPESRAGSQAGSENRYLAALGEIEALFDDLPLETVTLATGVRYAPADGLTRRLAAGWLSGTAVDAAAVHAPVHVDDVAHAVGVADRQRSVLGELHVRLALVGPEQMPLHMFLDRLGAPDTAGTTAGRPAPAWVADWLSRSAVAPPVDRAGITVARAGTRLPDGVAS